LKPLSAYKTLAIAVLAFSLIFSTIACSRFGVTTSTSKEWAYRFVKWNDHFYVVTDETVSGTEKMLGKIIKHSTNELDEFPNNSSNYFPEGTKLYEIAGLEPEQYIAVATEDGIYVKAVEREIWEKMNTVPTTAGQITERLIPQYDIPRQESWVTAEQVLEQAFSMVDQLQQRGSLVPVSLRLTTFDKVAHGGEYLPANTPVWHVVFKADGRVWVPTSGPAVHDPKDAYSHTQVVTTVEIALQAKSGQQIFEGVSGGRLDTTRQLEELKGVVADHKDQGGDRVIVETAGGDAVNVLLPRGMTAEAIDPASGTRTKLTFWETLNLQPGTPVTTRGLKTKTGEFLSYVLEAEVSNTRKNLAEIYILALDSFMPLDKGLNHDMKFIAIDTRTLEEATGEDKKQVLDYFKKYGVDVLDASLEELKEQGLFDEKKMVLDGILLRVKNIDVKPDMVTIEGSKYRSGNGAIGVISTLIYKEGKWQLKEAKMAWIS